MADHGSHKRQRALRLLEMGQRSRASNGCQSVNCPQAAREMVHRWRAMRFESRCRGRVALFGHECRLRHLKTVRAESGRGRLFSLEASGDRQANWRDLFAVM